LLQEKSCESNPESSDSPLTDLIFLSSAQIRKPANQKTVSDLAARDATTRLSEVDVSSRFLGPKFQGRVRQL
jgi:hypothetical protein